MAVDFTRVHRRLLIGGITCAVAGSAPALVLVGFGQHNSSLWTGGTGAPSFSNSPPGLGSAHRPVAVAVGPLQSTMFIDHDGSLYVCGRENQFTPGRFEQGNSGAPGGSTLVPLKYNGGLPMQNIIAVADSGTAEANFGIALRGDGVPIIWGYFGGAPDTGAGGVLSPLGNGTGMTGSLAKEVLTSSGGPAFTHVKAIAAGNHGAYVLKDDGTLWSWGYGGNSCIGQSSTKNFPTAMTMVGGAGPVKDVKEVRAGVHHGLALTSSGSVISWGANTYGQLGFPKASVPSSLARQIIGLTNVKQVACSKESSFALKADGTLWGWGRNADRILGLPNLSAYADKPTLINGPRFSKIWTGNRRIYGLTGSGAVYALGFGYAGLAMLPTSQTNVLNGAGSNPSLFLYASGKAHVLEENSPFIPVDATPGGVYGVRKFLRTVAGGSRNILLDAGGHVWENSSNYLPGLNNIIDISADGDQTVALDDMGQVWFWGVDRNGLCGAPNLTVSPTKLPSFGFHGQVISAQISRGGLLTLLSNGVVLGKGSNMFGMMGTGSILPASSAPVKTALTQVLTNIISVACGGDSHCVALSGSGLVYAWGRNTNGPVGLTSNMSTYAAQIAFPPTDRIKAINIGNETTYAVSGSGRAYSLGLNDEAQLLTWGPLSAYGVKNSSPIDVTAANIGGPNQTISAFSGGDRNAFLLFGSGLSHGYIRSTTPGSPSFFDGSAQPGPGLNRYYYELGNCPTSNAFVGLVP